MPRRRGYTLIELVVSLAVLSLLAALAYSSYQNHMIKVNRSAAEQFMTDIATRQAEYLIDARTYANSTGASGLNIPMPTAVSNSYNVTIAVTIGPPLGYLITATPTGRQTQDGVLTLDDTGQKLPVGKW